MSDEYTGTKSVSWAGAQPDPQALNEQKEGDISHVPDAKTREHHKHEKEILAVSHGAAHPSGERVKVDQPPDVSQLIDASKFSGAPSESKGNTNE